MLKHLLRPIPDLPLRYLITTREFGDGLRVHFYATNETHSEPVEVFRTTILPGSLTGSVNDWIQHMAKEIYFKLKHSAIPIACSEMYDASLVFTVEYVPGAIQYLAVGIRSNDYEEFPWKPGVGTLPIYTRGGGEETTSDEIMTVFGYVSPPIRELMEKVEKPGRLVVVNNVSTITFTHDSPPTENYLQAMGLPYTGVFYNDCLAIEQLFSKGIQCRLN